MRITDPIERLARAICWAEFGRHKPKEHTEASYWEACAPEVREDRIREAKRICWVLSSTADIDDDTLNDASDAYEAAHP
jgi:hypothetical protein